MKMSLCIPMYNENSIIADTATTAVQTGATGRLRSWVCRTSAW